MVKWQTKKLGDICDFQNGFAFKSSEYTNSGFFVMRIGNVQDGYISLSKPKYVKKSHELFEKFILQSGDILISLTGNVGRVGIIQEEHLPAVINQRVARVSLKNENIIKKQFLLYYLKSSYFVENLIDAGHGAAQQNVSTSDIGNIKIPLPHLPTQHRIVKILDEVFSDIAQAKEHAEKNLQNAKELFESYLQGVFANPGEDWENDNLKNICDVEYGYTEKAKSDGDYRFVRITDTDENGLLTQEKKMYVESFKEASKYTLHDGDLLMARTGASAGNVLLFEGVQKAVFASYLIRIKFNKDISSKLYWYFSKSRLYWNQVDQLSAGSAQPQFNGGALKQIVYTFPKSFAEQKSIVAKLDTLSAETKKLEAIYQQKLENLEELKKSVLKKAFAGELVE